MSLAVCNGAGIKFDPNTMGIDEDGVLYVKSNNINFDTDTLGINGDGELYVKAAEGGAAVANATDASDVITQLNALLTSLRTAGIIKTT